MCEEGLVRFMNNERNFSIFDSNLPAFQIDIDKQINAVKNFFFLLRTVAK